MTKREIASLAIKLMGVSIAIMVTAIIGCNINCCPGRNFNHRAEKQINVSSSVSPALRLFTDLTYTDITVVGQQTSECTVDAELTVSATSQEIADCVAEQLSVELIEETDRLAIKVQKPQEYKDDYTVSGKMRITVPAETRMEMTTTYGDLKFEGVRGDIAAVTKYGDIHVANTQNESVGLITKYGKITLKDCIVPKIECATSYDPILLNTVTANSLDLVTKYASLELMHCTAKKALLKTSYGAVRGEITDIDQITVQTSYAPIHLKCINPANPDIVADLKTKYDNIEFCPPAGFAGSVSASTSYGKIHTERPIEVQGVIGDHLNGTIGQGTGSITMTNKYGNVTLKSPKAK